LIETTKEFIKSVICSSRYALTKSWPYELQELIFTNNELRVRSEFNVFLYLQSLPENYQLKLYKYIRYELISTFDLQFFVLRKDNIIYPFIIELILEILFSRFSRDYKLTRKRIYTQLNYLSNYYIFSFFEVKYKY